MLSACLYRQACIVSACFYRQAGALERPPACRLTIARSLCVFSLARKCPRDRPLLTPAHILPKHSLWRASLCWPAPASSSRSLRACKHQCMCANANYPPYRHRARSECPCAPASNPPAAKVVRYPCCLAAPLSGAGPARQALRPTPSRPHNRFSYNNCTKRLDWPEPAWPKTATSAGTIPNAVRYARACHTAMTKHREKTKAHQTEPHPKLAGEQDLATGATRPAWSAYPRTRK